jgi:hypothetical protein
MASRRCRLRWFACDGLPPAGNARLKPAIPLAPLNFQAHLLSLFGRIHRFRHLPRCDIDTFVVCDNKPFALAVILVAVGERRYGR